MSFDTRPQFWQAVWPVWRRLPLTSALTGAVFVAWIMSWATLVFVAAIAVLSLVASALGSAPGIGAVAITDPMQLAVWTIGGSSAAGCMIVIFGMLRGIFRSLVAGDPFVPKNAGRLRYIAVTLGVLELMRHLVATGAALSQTLSPRGADANVVVWIAVVVLVVLAHVFSEGARLRENDKLTV